MAQVYFCNMCGARKAAAKGSLPQGEARCQACRRICPVRRPSPRAQRQSPRAQSICPVCENAFVPLAKAGGRWTAVCSHHCEQRRRNPVARSTDDRRSTRHQREIAAPGLSVADRAKLLRSWKAVGRVCSYCSAAASTVDHVVPLFRGGTNFEGNLVPACRRCNSSKGTLFLVEWRYRNVEAMRVLRSGLRSAA